MYRGALVSGFVNISVYFNKLAIDFLKELRWFSQFKLRISQPLLRFQTHPVLRVEMILESYAKVYSNQFMTG